MAHGERAAKNANMMREYWSRRSPQRYGMTHGRFSKRLTARAERRQAKRGCLQDLG